MLIYVGIEFKFLRKPVSSITVMSKITTITVMYMYNVEDFHNTIIFINCLIVHTFI